MVYLEQHACRRLNPQHWELRHWKSQEEQVVLFWTVHYPYWGVSPPFNDIRGFNWNDHFAKVPECQVFLELLAIFVSCLQTRGLFAVLCNFVLSGATLLFVPSILLCLKEWPWAEHVERGRRHYFFYFFAVFTNETKGRSFSWYII